MQTEQNLSQVWSVAHQHVLHSAKMAGHLIPTPLVRGMWAGWEEHDTARLTLQELMAGGGLPASPLPSGSRSFLEGDLSVSCLPQ